MQCVSLRTRRLIHPITGVETFVPYPCGKCIACLHNQQDAWAIRLNEEAMHTEKHEFIYDTLTFSPQGMPYQVLTEVPDNVSSEARDLLSRYSNEYARVTGECAEAVVPYVTRDIIRDWIRRGRELFVYHHGYRPDWKSVVFMEYGPRTSRPHFHLLFFNISYGDYIKYLAKPWRRTYGYTKTKLVDNTSSKGRQCVSRYVSKYCSKGVFESPLVFFGLAPKPFRCISNGIGRAYLQHSSFDSFRTSKAVFFRGLQAKPLRDREYDCPMGYDYSSIAKFYDSFGKEDASFFESFNLDKLKFYIDESSFKHSLPRYYKRILLGSDKPNYFHVQIQDLLQFDYSKYRKGKLFEFALSMGYKQAQKEASFLGFSPEQYDALDRQFFVASVLEARSQAKRRFIKLKNHYFRPLRNKAYAYVS